MQLSAEQVILIGFVSTLIVQAVKLVTAKFKLTLDRKWITVILMVVAVFLAYIWARPELPAWPGPVDDPMIYFGLVVAFIGKIIVALSAIAGSAKILYNLLFQGVFDKLGIGKALITDLSKKPELGPDGLPF